MKNSTKTLGILIFVLLFLTNLAVSDSYVFPGNSLSGPFGSWGGTGYFYSPTFNVNAAGGIDITYYDIDLSQLTFGNTRTLKGLAEPGVSKSNSMTSIDPNANSIWCNLMNMEIAPGVDWNNNPISTLGPDGIAKTADDTRHGSHQDWYRPATGGKVNGPGADIAHNNESYITPNPRFPGAPIKTATELNSYDFRLRILPTGTNTYTYEMWTRMHNAASNIEGCAWCVCGMWNHAINNCGEAGAWRSFANGGNTVFPIANFDLSSVYVFMGLGNYQDPASQSITWGRIEVTGTLLPPSEVWVDSAYTSSGSNDGHLWGYDAFDKIQDGINAVSGSTVHVAKGTYEEQVEINKTLTLDGAGKGVTIIRSPTTLTKYFTTPGNNNYPVVYVHDATGVTVKDLTVDGLGRGDLNYRFIGIAYYNADGTVDNCVVKGIRDYTFSGAQHGVGIYAYNSGGGPYTLNSSGTEVEDFQKTGMALLGNNLTVNLSNCTVTGHGLTSVTAQNGIQISNGAGGTVTNCSVSGIGYTGTGYVGSGMLFLQGTTVTVSGGSSVTGSQASIIFQETQGSVNGVTITSGDVVSAEGISIRDYGYAIAGGGDMRAVPVSPLEEAGKTQPGDKGTSTTVTINNAHIYGVHHAGSYGIAAWAMGDNVNVTLTNSQVRDWEYGVVAMEYPSTVQFVAHNNSIESNDGGVYTNAASVQDFENNWWGSNDGPEDVIGTDEATLTQCYDVSTMKNTVPELSGTLGNDVTGDVDYCPWVGGDAGFDAEIYAGCNDPCDDFCLDVKLSGTDIRFFHFEYPLPVSGCIDLVSSSGSLPNLVTFQTTMFGNVLHIDGSFDSPNFTGTNMKVGSICFRHDGTCPDIVQTLTCTADEVRDGAGNLVDVSPGLAIINVDNDTPDKDHPTGDILPCYSAADDLDWACWNLAFHKGSEEWQCDLLQATIRIYKAAGCNTGDLVFTHDFFTATIPGDFSICYPTNQAERNAIWATLTSDGTYYVRLTVKDNCCNQADNCDAFTFCRDTHTANYMTCLDAKPAHNHICLEWNYTPDVVNAVKLRILRSPFRVGNYPEYAASNPVPSGYDDASWYQVYEGTDTYPCNEATWFQDNGQGCNGGGTFFANNTRDIYWYAGFTQDAAGNWSAADMTLGTGADRATSYWLGDVTNIPGTGGPDGYVYGFTGDVGRLTSAYGTIPPSDNTVDYGPATQEHGIGRGIPIPDDVINYKDLLPFSYNYNIVGPSGSCSTWPLLATNQPPRQLNKAAQPVSVWLEKVASTQHDGITFALMVTNPEDAIHLFHSQISYNSNALSLMQVRRGEVGITQGSAEFFAHPNTGDGLVDVDLAALGPDAYVVGSGAVAYLDFSYKATGMPSKIALKEAILYDGEGNEIDLSPTDVDVENQGEATPTEFALYYNHPNPFNPTTLIKYDLPQASYVKLVVYNVMGQKVATLVDGMVQAGRQQVIWDAKDLSSGIYFYKITAGNFTQMHKMILLK